MNLSLFTKITGADKFKVQSLSSIFIIIKDPSNIQVKPLDCCEKHVISYQYFFRPHLDYGDVNMIRLTNLLLY